MKRILLVSPVFGVDAINGFFSGISNIADNLKAGAMALGAFALVICGLGLMIPSKQISAYIKSHIFHVCIGALIVFAAGSIIPTLISNFAF